MTQELIPVLSAANAAVTQTGAAILARNLMFASLQNVSTGTAVGTMKLQFSNDIITTPALTPVNWTDIPSATVAITAASVTGIPITNLCYQYIRVVYTFTSGTGTISANLKTIGA